MESFVLLFCKSTKGTSVSIVSDRDSAEYHADDLRQGGGKVAIVELNVNFNDNPSPQTDFGADDDMALPRRS